MLNFLKRKGIIATIIGIFIAVPGNIKLIQAIYSSSMDLSDGQLKAIGIINLIAIIWVMLPSTITLSAGSFNFKLED